VNKLLLILILILSLNAKEDLQRFNVAYMTNSMSNYSKKDLKISMNIWLKEISKEAGYDANMFFYDNPKDAVIDLKNNKIDYISAFPLVFVKYFNETLLTDAFSGGPKNIKNTIFVILSHTNINKLKDLKNPKIGIQIYDEIMYMYIKLKLNNNTPNIKGYSKRSKIVLDLFFNKIDIAIVPLRNFLLAKELNPQIYKKVKILEETNINATNFAFYRKSLNKSIQKKIFKEAKKMFSSKKGKQMMLIYKADKIIKTKLDNLKPVKELYNKYIIFKKRFKND